MKSYILIDERKKNCTCSKCLGSAWYDPFDIEGMFREKCFSEVKKELAKYIPIALVLTGTMFLYLKK